MGVQCSSNDDCTAAKLTAACGVEDFARGQLCTPASPPSHFCPCVDMHAEEIMANLEGGSVYGYTDDFKRMCMPSGTSSPSQLETCGLTEPCDATSCQYLVDAPSYQMSYNLNPEDSSQGHAPVDDFCCPSAKSNPSTHADVNSGGFTLFDVGTCTSCEDMGCQRIDSFASCTEAGELLSPDQTGDFALGYPSTEQWPQGCWGKNSADSYAATGTDVFWNSNPSSGIHLLTSEIVVGASTGWKKPTVAIDSDTGLVTEVAMCICQSCAPTPPPSAAPPTAPTTPTPKPTVSTAPRDPTGWDGRSHCPSNRQWAFGPTMSKCCSGSFGLTKMVGNVRYGLQYDDRPDDCRIGEFVLAAQTPCPGGGPCADNRHNGLRESGGSSGDTTTLKSIVSPASRESPFC